MTQLMGPLFLQPRHFMSTKTNLLYRAPILTTAGNKCRSPIIDQISYRIYRSYMTGKFSPQSAITIRFNL